MQTAGFGYYHCFETNAVKPTFKPHMLGIGNHEDAEETSEIAFCDRRDDLAKLAMIS